MSFLGKLWRGEYPLWVHYWIYGVVACFALFAAFVFTWAKVMPRLSSGAAGGVELAFFLLFLFGPCYLLVALRGVWLSAEDYAGHQFWKLLAKFSVIMMCIKIIKYSYVWFASLGLL
ncbi:hypothetical protein [Halodesulfovibrio sp.]|jgi:hypothetical protein|uniref:hypothetical protein n=1 Tax=Halodesulfovibrio sp. TaxID=1912772 RepID=UPI0025CE239F|nr:hypothetical protein [Halodesulfovibrio sp.]MCT4625835.1 hypothetical protein [Halodesulfovibrio sp.]